MPMPCKLCHHPERKAVETAFASGLTDREIGRRFGVSHMAALRHRRDHLVKPMLAAVATLDRGAAERQLAAGARKDPVDNVIASLNLAAQANKLATIEGRLERMSVAAEATGSSAGVAALSAQALRSVEVGSRLASTGGYATPRTAGEASEAKVFSISIHFAGSGRTEEINILETRRSAAGEETDGHEDAGAVDGTAATDD